jgi:predicted TIM-barrel fold metal-dependent hydrolase
MSDHLRWLAQVGEEALEPDRAIVDPHHHLWDTPAERYLIGELQADTGAGHNVEATIYVDCMSGYRTDGPTEYRTVGETEFALAQARQAAASGGSRIDGIVSWVDMTLGAAAGDVLDAHLAAGEGLFKGIRHASAWDADPKIGGSHTHAGPGLFGEVGFRQGLRQLADRNLTFDAWLYHPQIPEVGDLAAAVPDLRIVLDHLGGPLGIASYAGRRDEITEVWKRDLAAVARQPNVFLKVGGIGMTLYGLGWHKRPLPPTSAELAAAWGDQLRFAIDQFGPSRCMFESNFPVDRRSCSYAVLWNTFKRVADDAGYSEAEKGDLFAGTARRAYLLA